MSFSIFHNLKKDGPLNALFLNCTLKQGPETSNTEALCNLLIERLKAHEPDIETEIVRVVDYNVKPGIGNDEGEGDEWPLILEKIKRCNIIVPAMPIWMGVRSSVMQRVIERLDGTTKTVMCEADRPIPPLRVRLRDAWSPGMKTAATIAWPTRLRISLHFGVTVPPEYRPLLGG